MRGPANGGGPSDTVAQRRTLMRTDYSPFYRSTIGFDRLFDLLDSATKFDTGSSYPPYDIEATGENQYRITMAVAGFGETDLDVETHENVLSIKGSKGENEDGAKYLYHGIAARSFERRFQLADHVVVTGAKLENGLLHVDLKREIPEALKPRRIEIGSGSKAKVLEPKAA
jgi:molecular chaperone IbpA